MSRDGTGQDFFKPSGKFQNHRRSTGFRSVFDRPGRPVFLQKVFFHYSMYLMKNFQKEGGKGEVVKYVTLDGGLRKKTQKFLRFLRK